MLETSLAVYAASVFVFFMMNLWTASEAVKLSSSARGKEIKQFYKGVASDRLGLLKWSPIWIVPVLKNIIALVRWRLDR